VFIKRCAHTPMTCNGDYRRLAWPKGHRETVTPGQGPGSEFGICGLFVLSEIENLDVLSLAKRPQATPLIGRFGIIR
jgi:hypothetical protein